MVPVHVGAGEPGAPGASRVTERGVSWLSVTQVVGAPDLRVGGHRCINTAPRKVDRRANPALKESEVEGQLHFHRSQEQRVYDVVGGAPVSMTAIGS